MTIGNTHRDLLSSGEWTLLGRKHYAHVSGAEVRYNCMTFLWDVLGAGESHKALWFAAHRATRIGA